MPSRHLLLVPSESMENIPDKDNISHRSHGSKRPHTYTPGSHEDLLRSHLDLAAARKTKLRDDLQKLTDENDRLKNQLHRAQDELQDKDNKINELKDELRNKPDHVPAEDRPRRTSPPMFDFEGKPVTLDYVIDHFNVILKRHHDLLNQKNTENQQLHDALKDKQKQDVPPSPKYAREDDLRQQQLMDEMIKQMEEMKDHYDKVEKILVERTQQLEDKIEHRNELLTDYAKEIKKLRNELASRDLSPPPQDDNLIKQLEDKQKENEYLKDIINSLKDQRPADNNIYPETNENLENEVKKVIENQKQAVDNLNNAINELKNAPLPPDDTVEEECQEVLEDLNNVKDKVNKILDKSRASPQSNQEDGVGKRNVVPALENVLKQCQDDVDALENQLQNKDTPDTVILRGQAVVKIDDPKKKGKDGQEPTEAPSNIQFMLYPSQQHAPPPRRTAPYRPADPSPPPRSYRPADTSPSAPPPPPVRTFPPPHRSDVPCEACEACSDATLQPDKSVSFTPRERETIPESESKPTKPKETPKEMPKETRIHEFYSPSQRALSRDRAKKPKSQSGCCGGKKPSETSTVPYSKYSDEEKEVNVHAPEDHKEKEDKKKEKQKRHKPKIANLK